MDPLSGLNRGYAFVTFCGKEAAQEAVKLVRAPVITGKKSVQTGKLGCGLLPFLGFM